MARHLVYEIKWEATIHSIICVYEFVCDIVCIKTKLNFIEPWHSNMLQTASKDFFLFGISQLNGNRRCYLRINNVTYICSMFSGRCSSEWMVDVHLSALKLKSILILSLNLCICEKRFYLNRKYLCFTGRLFA